jgi:hypothetical protein
MVTAFDFPKGRKPERDQFRSPRLVLLVAAEERCRRRGLGGGRTIALDRVTLMSRRNGATGRPDRITREGGRHSGGMEILIGTNPIPSVGK